MRSEKLTVTLNDHAPITITKEKWPIIARAKDWDNQYECQANRTWFLRVRQHEDGRTIVYGGFDTCFQGEGGSRAGELLEKDADIPAAIKRVAENCNCEGIADKCIADLPAVEVEE